VEGFSIFIVFGLCISVSFLIHFLGSGKFCQSVVALVHKQFKLLMQLGSV
jgi:hypothetical protein